MWGNETHGKALYHLLRLAMHGVVIRYFLRVQVYILFLVLPWISGVLAKVGIGHLQSKTT